MKVNELLNEDIKTVSPKTKTEFSKLAKLIKTEPLKNNFNVGDSGDFWAISASELMHVNHYAGFLIYKDNDIKNILKQEIFFYDNEIKRWVQMDKWNTFTASELIKYGRKLGDEYGWAEITPLPKKIKTLKEENESIPRDIRRAAMHAGYDINKKELRTMIGLKLAYAKRSLESKYADQFDVKLGEVLGMINMDEKQLKDFIKNNG